MDFGKYEKYMNDRKAVTVENNRRIEKKFAECEKWVADNLINCGCVFTNHSELLQKQSFMIWIDNGISISHKIYKLSECGITPLVLLPYPGCMSILCTSLSYLSQGFSVRGYCSLISRLRSTLVCNISCAFCISSCGISLSLYSSTNS